MGKNRLGAFAETERDVSFSCLQSGPSSPDVRLQMGQAARPMIRLFVSLWFFCGIVYAAPQMKSDDQGNPLISQYSEEGFVDCVFKIAELTETDATYRFRLIGTYKGEIVGMGVNRTSYPFTLLILQRPAKFQLPGGYDLASFDDGCGVEQASKRIH